MHEASQQQASQTQHQHQVLHGSAAGTFAQIVQPRGANGVEHVVIAVHANFEQIGVFQRHSVELAVGGRIFHLLRDRKSVV